MNLFWKRAFGLLIPTTKYEQYEVDFLIASEKLKSLQYSSTLTEYKKLLLSNQFASSETKKQNNIRISQLERHPDIVFFRKNIGKRNKPNRYASLTFSDDFYKEKPEENIWNFGFYFTNENLIKNYSFHNEKQANNLGNNTTTFHGVIRIQTRREAIKALAWHPQKGFAEKQYAYTSDVVQTAKNFRQERGVFKAKIRCSGNVNHAFWLRTEKMDPQINIFHFDGSEIKVGFINNQKGSAISIKGINPSQYYIYTLEWTKEELIWYINNVVVFRSVNDIPTEKMFLVFNSFIPENTNGDEGLLEVDWVRVYQWIDK
ncbi:hypothetical protein MASR2M117_16490 [Paludibacter sp.]